MANPRTIAKLEARVLERAAHCIEFELSDPRSGFITVTKVELASDLSAGKIFYTVLGSRAERSRIARMLEDAAGYLQRQIARAISVRRMPHLRWVYDESIEYALEMDQKIDEALRRDESIQAGAAPPGEAAPDWEVEYEAFSEEPEES